MELVEVETMDRDVERQSLAVVGAPSPEYGLLTEEIVLQYEKHLKMLSRLRVALVGVTKPAHWMAIGDTPYPKDDAITWIAGTMGIRPKVKPLLDVVEYEDSMGKLMEVTCEYHAVWRGESYFEIGSATSRDDFVSVGKNGTVIPYEKIDKGDIKKKAITNALHRVVNRITGIDGTTWEMLADAGIKRDQVGGGYGFRGGESKATGVGEITEGKKRMWAMMVEICGDETNATQWLGDLTEGPDKKFKRLGDYAALSEKTFGFINRLVEAEYRKFQADMRKATQSGAAAPARDPGQEG